jgi:hypothetical protein
MIFLINIGLITDKYDEFDDNDSIIFGVSFIGGGCLGCYVFGLFISKKPKFYWFCVSVALLHFLAYLAFVLTLEFY